MCKQKPFIHDLSGSYEAMAGTVSVPFALQNVDPKKKAVRLKKGLPVFQRDTVDGLCPRTCR